MIDITPAEPVPNPFKPRRIQTTLFRILESKPNKCADLVPEKTNRMQVFLSEGTAGKERN